MDSAPRSETSTLSNRIFSGGTPNTSTSNGFNSSKISLFVISILRSSGIVPELDDLFDGFSSRRCRQLRRMPQRHQAGEVVTGGQIQCPSQNILDQQRSGQHTGS